MILLALWVLSTIFLIFFCKTQRCGFQMAEPSYSQGAHASNQTSGSITEGQINREQLDRKTAATKKTQKRHLPTMIIDQNHPLRSSI